MGAESQRRRPRGGAPLSRDAIVHAAVDAADKGGISALTMRGIAGRLGVEAMSLYHHIADKRALLEAAAERVWQGVDTETGAARAGGEHVGGAPAAALDWADSIRLVAGRVHETLLAHAWVLEVASSAGGESRMRVIEVMLRELTRAGLTDDDVYEGYHLIDALILGYTAQEASYRRVDMVGADATSAAGPGSRSIPVDFPYVTAHARAHAAPRDATSGFRDGLDLVLQVLSQRVRP